MNKNIDRHSDGLHIRTIIPDDKDQFIHVQIEAGEISESDKEGQEKDLYWQVILRSENIINMIVFREDDGLCIGTCSLHRFSGNYVELGYNVLKAIRRHGFGTVIARNLVGIAHEVFPDKDVMLRVRTDNFASQHIAEKCGGELVKYEPTPEAELCLEALEKYGHLEAGEQENIFFTAEQIRQYKEIVEKGKNGVVVYRIP